MEYSCCSSLLPPCARSMRTRQRRATAERSLSSRFSSPHWRSCSGRLRDPSGQRADPYRVTLAPCDLHPICLICELGWRLHHRSSRSPPTWVDENASRASLRVAVALCHSSAHPTHNAATSEWFWCEVIHIGAYGLHAARRTIAKLRHWRGLSFGTAVAKRSLTCERAPLRKSHFLNLERVGREPWSSRTRKNASAGRRRASAERSSERDNTARRPHGYKSKSGWSNNCIEEVWWVT